MSLLVTMVLIRIVQLPHIILRTVAHPLDHGGQQCICHYGIRPIKVFPEFSHLEQESRRVHGRGGDPHISHFQVLIEVNGFLDAFFAAIGCQFDPLFHHVFEPRVRLTHSQLCCNTTSKRNVLTTLSLSLSL